MSASPDGYSHAAWLAGLTSRTHVLTGDERALAAIREATRIHHGAEDITPDAPVYIWHGIYVKGLGAMAYQIPDQARDRFIEIRPFPENPAAVFPEPSPTRREELFAASMEAEGDIEAFEEIRTRTRLYHEVAPKQFPAQTDIRWFINGLHIIGPGEDPVVFQVPMDRVSDMVIPRVAPKLPWLTAPKPVA